MSMSQNKVEAVYRVAYGFRPEDSFLGTSDPILFIPSWESLEVISALNWVQVQEALLLLLLFCDCYLEYAESDPK